MSEIPRNQLRMRNPIGGDNTGDRPDEQRQMRRTQTLDQLGTVSVNPGPLLTILRAPANDPDMVAAAIEQCPTLSARLLSVSNSSAFHSAHAIKSVQRAVLHLGANRARLITLAFGLRLLVEGCSLPSRVGHQLWIASLRKAVAARLVCLMIDPRRADEAYASALIQDIGLAMLMAVDSSFYLHHLTPGSASNWCDMERRHFSIDHCEVGCHLLRAWKSSPYLLNCIAHHHRLSTDGESEEALARVPLFVASLLPHLGEEPTPTEHDWIIALHAKFLAPSYPTPQAFFEAVDKEAAKIYQQSDSDEATPRFLTRKLIREVATDTLSMVGQLCRLETALGRQREGFDELRFQAFTDPLTKVLNRRGFAQLAERRLDDAIQHNLGICCALLDLDDFKPVNDRLGHEAGDLVLRGLAKLLRRNLDRSDLIGRLGGDEFAILLVGVDETKAHEIVQRIASACKGTRIRIADGIETPLKLSLGAVHASEPTSQLSIDGLIAAADEAMYERKHGHKNGMIFHTLRPPASIAVPTTAN